MPEKALCNRWRTEEKLGGEKSCFENGGMEAENLPAVQRPDGPRLGKALR